MLGSVQGYLAHKKTPPFRTLLQADAWGPTIVLGGVHLLMSEVPLYDRRYCWRFRRSSPPRQPWRVSSPLPKVCQPLVVLNMSPSGAQVSVSPFTHKTNCTK